MPFTGATVAKDGIYRSAAPSAQICSVYRTEMAVSTRIKNTAQGLRKVASDLKSSRVFMYSYVYLQCKLIFAHTTHMYSIHILIHRHATMYV